MVRKKFAFGAALVALVVLLWATGGIAAGPPPEGPGPIGGVTVQALLGTAFTYQGQLKEDGSPVNDTCDFQFSLWDAASGGAQIGTTQTATGVTVSNGLCTVQLDFGSMAFTGDARWLEVGVRCPAGSGSYTTLSPRQALTPAPYALALPGLWTQQNATSPNLIGGYSGNSVTSGARGATIGGGGASGYINRVTDDYGTVGGGFNNRAGSYATVGGGGGDTASGDWATVGGGGGNTASGSYATVGGGHRNAASGLGATVGGGVENAASGSCATVGGGLGNQAEAQYATIAGGGRSDPTDPATGNRVTDDYVTVGGGGNNQAGNANADLTDAIYATVGGGYDNTASGGDATVGGGGANTASGHSATVGGGRGNTASGHSATVGGGYGNTASGHSATVGGGRNNTAQGDYSFAAGQRAKANHQGAFVWADSTDADFTSTADDQFLVRASGGVRLTTLGGGLRLEPNTTSPNLIGGYSGNRVANGVVGATIGGGGGSTVANNVADDYGTVGGGFGNLAGAWAGTTSDQEGATVGGGELNLARGTKSTVGGGYANDADGYAATVGGGYYNHADGYYATVGGGNDNTASGNYATVGGSYFNTASGLASTVPGGYMNTAQGNYSFAAGRRAKANHAGSFVWGDSTDADVASQRDNQFLVRAKGGALFDDRSGNWVNIWNDGAGKLINTSTGAYLSTGGAWTNASDREAKANFAAVDAQEVLARLAAIPIQTWNYKSQDPSVRHIGPVAQDFYAAFGLGEDDEHISTMDADGVALAAILGLYQFSQEQAARIQALEAENAALQQRLDDLEARMAALEAASAQPLQSGLLPGAGVLLAGLGLIWVARREGGR